MQVLFDEMFRFVKGLVDYMRFVKTPSLERRKKYPYFKLFFQDDEILSLAETLKEIIPLTCDNIVYSSKSYQKLKLIQITEKIETLKRDHLPDTNFSISIAQQELARMNIWGFTCENIHSYSSPPWNFSYFDLIMDKLSIVNLPNGVRLQNINLSSSENNIYVNLEWYGPFEKIELLTILDVPQQLWSATCDTQDLSLPITMMRYLLYLQVVIAWGENKLIARNVNKDGALTASIQIQIANSQEPSMERPLSETGWQSVSDYIVQQSYSRYSVISQKLEMKLNEELERRKLYAKQGVIEIEHVNQIQDGIDNLAQYKKDYFEEITGLK